MLSSTDLEQYTTFRDAAIRKFVRIVFLYTLLPLASLAWSNTQSWFAVGLSVAFVPCWVVAQGAFSLLTYRLYYADSPTPLTPRHGVVVVHPKDKLPSNDQGHKHQLHTSCSDFSISSEDGQPIGTCKDIEDEALYEIKYEAIWKRQESTLLNKAAKERPLRLLVIGDSLSIGVGQTRWPTPIMPETIAKTLSKKMGGRAVYWTCHGATGASIGWVIRELERGVEYLSKGGNINSSSIDDDSITDSETDESSLDEDSPAAEKDVHRRRWFRRSRGDIDTGDKPCKIEEWKRRLLLHRDRFEPDLQGFYDIAVVLTGPNDLKTAVMPFLFTDKERQEARAGASGFSEDLHLLLETLTRKMKQRLRFIRQSVEAAKESVIEKVEETMERITRGISKRMNNDDFSRFERCKDSKAPHRIEYKQAESHEHDDDDTHGRPLVVLPGMPGRALPIFQHEPVKWYAPHAVDIMDAYKKDAAAALPNDILFVPPPTKEEIADYVMQNGPQFAQRQREETLLSLRDIQRHDSAWQEQRMRAYYESKGTSAYLNNPFKRVRALAKPPSVHLKAFAVDGIHPNELGYDFWGRYLANNIFDEWQKREERMACTKRDGRKDQEDNCI